MFSSLKSPKRLDPSVNNLDYVSRIFRNLNFIEILYLNNNKIDDRFKEFERAWTVFHTGFCKLTELHLVRVTLDSDNISSIPSGLNNLIELKELYQSNNKLNNYVIGDLKRLEKLYFSRNKLSSIPHEFQQISLLKYVDLHDNKLGENNMNKRIFWRSICE